MPTKTWEQIKEWTQTDEKNEDNVAVYKAINELNESSNSELITAIMSYEVEESDNESIGFDRIINKYRNLIIAAARPLPTGSSLTLNAEGKAAPLEGMLPHMIIDTSQIIACRRRNTSCCMAGVRESLTAEMKEIHPQATHFIRQCMRKKISDGLFCRQHDCCPPMFVYEDGVNSYPKHADTNVEATWNTKVQVTTLTVKSPVAAEREPFLKTIDQLFCSGIKDLRELKVDNTVQLDKFKDSILESITAHLDSMMCAAHTLSKNCKVDFVSEMDGGLCDDE